MEKSRPDQPAARVPFQAIDLICYDFDGVMTDNRVLVGEDGREAVLVNRGDGLAVAALKRRGIAQIILSTEANPVVAQRARKLDIPCVQDLSDKARALSEYASARGHDLSRTIYVGNDVNDLEAMRLVGCRVAPADAHASVLREATFITQARGGEGVIREMLDIILNSEGR